MESIKKLTEELYKIIDKSESLLAESLKVAKAYSTESFTSTLARSLSDAASLYKEKFDKFTEAASLKVIHRDKMLQTKIFNSDIASRISPKKIKELQVNIYKFLQNMAPDETVLLSKVSAYDAVSEWLSGFSDELPISTYAFEQRLVDFLETPPKDTVAFAEAYFHLHMLLESTQIQLTNARWIRNVPLDEINYFQGRLDDLRFMFTNYDVKTQTTKFSKTTTKLNEAGQPVFHTTPIQETQYFKDTVYFQMKLEQMYPTELALLDESFNECIDLLQSPDNIVYNYITNLAGLGDEHIKHTIGAVESFY